MSRPIDLRPGFCSIRGQGDLGSCTAFAATAILEYIRNRVHAWYTDRQKKGKELSARFLYFNSRTSWRYSDERSAFCPINDHNAAGCVRDMDVGARIKDVKQAVEKYGCCDDSAWPYKGCSHRPYFNDPAHDPSRADESLYRHSHNIFAFKPPKSCYDKGKSIHKYISSIDNIPSNPDAWRDEIQKENPVFITVWTPPQFKNAGKMLVYDRTDPIDPGRDEGHAVVLCGYWKIAGDERFLVRNSWGDSWGDGGYLWVSRQTLERMTIHPNSDDSLVFRCVQSFIPFPGPPEPSQPPPLPTPVPDEEGPAPQPGPTPAPDTAGRFKVFGQISSGTGRLLQDMMVYINTTEGNMVKGVHSDGMGRYIIDDVESGTYQLVAADPSGAFQEQKETVVVSADFRKDFVLQPAGEARPEPTPPPAPQPTPEPPLTPPPGDDSGIRPHRGEFVYQWWLFRDMGEFRQAEALGLSPYGLVSRNLGKKIGPPDRRTDNDYDRKFGTTWHGTNNPKKDKNSPNQFKDFDNILSDPDHAEYKVVALGACRIAEIRGVHPLQADNQWKWDHHERSGPKSPQMKIEKHIKGNTSEPVEFKFKVTNPEKKTVTLPVTVEQGKDPVGSITVETMAGPHKVVEEPVEGFENVPGTDTEREFEVWAGKTAILKFFNRPKGISDKQHLTIEKEVKGKLDVASLFKFKVTLPDGGVKHVDVHVEPGDDPVGHTTIETQPGKHVIEEPELKGFIRVSDTEIEVNIEEGKEETVRFTNRYDEKEAPPPQTPTVKIIPKKNARLPHPPHEGTTSVPEFRQGTVMTIPDEERGTTDKEGGAGELDFMMLKSEGVVRLGWVCYIMRESDGEVVKPKQFSLRVIASVDKKNPMEYKGGYKYRIMKTGKRESKADSGYQITFDPYINISPRVKPGYYKMYLELAAWPEDLKRGLRADTTSKDKKKVEALDKMQVIDRNYVRFQVVEGEKKVKKKPVKKRGDNTRWKPRS